jgi:hypothetical protein
MPSSLHPYSIVKEQNKKNKSVIFIIRRELLSAYPSSHPGGDERI